MHENLEPFDWELQIKEQKLWLQFPQYLPCSQNSSKSLGQIFWLLLHVTFLYVWCIEKRLVGKNPLRCMRFIEAKFELNKYGTFSNRGSASEHVQHHRFSFHFSCQNSSLLPCTFCTLQKQRGGGGQYRALQCKLLCNVRRKALEVLMHLKPDTWQVLKDDGVAVEHYGVVLYKGKFHPFTTQLIPIEAFFFLSDLHYHSWVSWGEKDFQPMGIYWGQVLHNCRTKSKHQVAIWLGG